MHGKGLLRLVRAAGMTALISLPVAAQETAPPTQPAPPPAGGAAPPDAGHHHTRHDDNSGNHHDSPALRRRRRRLHRPNQLPPVDVIQKKAQPAPKAAAKKAPPKKQAAAPAPAPPPAEPPQLDTPATYQPGEGGIDSGTVQMSPVEGSSIPIGSFPGAVGRGSAEDFNRTGYTYAPEVLQQTVPGVILGDAQGNVFQRNLQYRGFESSPVNGVPQGLAVYQNGVRINESFGDIVNYDFLPDNAISGMTIIGANPVFGLNALGGALTIMMRDGFNFQGAELNVMGGSFGRYQGGLAVGGNSGSWGSFLSLEGIHDNGYRDFSASRIRRMYADLGAKGDGTEFHLNFTGAANYVGVTAAAPVQLLDMSWSNTFTSPQTTKNQVAMLSAQRQHRRLTDLVAAGRRLLSLVQAVAYRRQHLRGRRLRRRSVVLCLEGDDALSSAASAPASIPMASIPYGHRRPARLARPDLAARQQLRLRRAGREQGLHCRL